MVCVCARAYAHSHALFFLKFPEQACQLFHYQLLKHVPFGYKKYVVFDGHTDWFFCMLIQGDERCKD
jgi:hypothetical protein